MEAAGTTVHRQKLRSRGVYSILGFGATIIALVLIIALSVTLTKTKSPRRLPATILLPLYIYPDPNAWDPLYEVLGSYTQLDFTVVINPSDGPGSSATPGSDYVAAVQKLNAFPNVRTIGYIPTHYATRNVSSVLEDVATYAGWTTHSTNLSLHGVFFDEIPSKLPPNDPSPTIHYLQMINQAVKTAAGILADKLVVHNPGTIPDPRLVLNSTDIIVVFEGSYSGLQTQQSALAALPLSRSHYSYIVHSVPVSTNLKHLVARMRQHAQSLFVTSLTQDYYESFSGDWRAFVSSIQA